MNHLREIQRWLCSSNLTGLVVPSTDEYLSEWTPPADRRLWWATGFRGSTGMAVILREVAALFLDGRYRLQAAADVDRAAISIEPSTLASRRAWLTRSLVSEARLGIDPWLHSKAGISEWRDLAVEVGFQIELLASNPVDRLWSDNRPWKHRPQVVDYPVRYCGETSEAKRAGLVEHMKAAGLHALLLADPEDLSWLLNVRAADASLTVPVGDWPAVPSCTSRAILRRDGSVIWFIDAERLTPAVRSRGREVVTIAPPDSLPAALREIAREGPIGTDLRRTPAALTEIIEQEGRVAADETAARRRWRKHPAELESARRVHRADAVAVVRFLAWLMRTVPDRSVTELEAAEALDAFRTEHPDYKGPSMPLMSASGPSGAQPHYVPRRDSSRRLNDHPIYWMDSGGHYPGGTTDNTVTFALAHPEPKHVRAHTRVLQGHIALATARVPTGTCGHQLDLIARQVLWREGMDYAHGTGHGVGNYLNIHEGVLLGREQLPRTIVPIEPGMILTNEPGYYVDGDFGVRIESHMIVVASHYPDFLEFDTISRLPIDPHLVDFERLSSAERQWLANYHRTVLEDLAPLLDDFSAAWLRTLVAAFTLAAGGSDVSA